MDELVFEVPVPESQPRQVLQQVLVDHRELAAQHAPHVDVARVRLEALVVAQDLRKSQDVNIVSCAGHRSQVHAQCIRDDLVAVQRHFFQDIRLFQRATNDARDLIKTSEVLTSSSNGQTIQLRWPDAAQGLRRGPVDGPPKHPCEP